MRNCREVTRLVLAGQDRRLTAGERLSDTTRAAWIAATGKPVYEAYGLSECSTPVSGSPRRPAPPVGTAGPGVVVAFYGTWDAGLEALEPATRKDTGTCRALPEALLAAAERVLRRDGIAGLGLRAIAREAQVSHTAPKHHFGDTTSLLSQLAAVGFRRLRDGETQVLAGLISDEDFNARKAKILEEI